jgi:hypothetical protein
MAGHQVELLDTLRDQGQFSLSFFARAEDAQVRAARLEVRQVHFYIKNLCLSAKNLLNLLNSGRRDFLCATDKKVNECGSSWY